MVADRVIQLQNGKRRWTCGTCGQEGDVEPDRPTAAWEALDEHIDQEHR